MEHDATKKEKDTGKNKGRHTGPCEHHASGGLPCILIVENDRGKLHRLAETLQGKYNIALADTGDGAFAKLAEMDRADLVLTDMATDTDNGQGCFAWRLARNSDYQHVPVLCMAGQPEETWLFSGIDRFGFMEKPFVPGLLATKIRGMLVARQLTVKLASDKALRKILGQDTGQPKVKYLAVLELTDQEANILGWLRDGLSGGKIFRGLENPEPGTVSLIGRHESNYHQNKPYLVERLEPPPNNKSHKKKQCGIDRGTEGVGLLGCPPPKTDKLGLRRQKSKQNIHKFFFISSNSTIHELGLPNMAAGYTVLLLFPAYSFVPWRKPGQAPAFQQNPPPNGARAKTRPFAPRSLKNCFLEKPKAKFSGACCAQANTGKRNRETTAFAQFFP